MQAEPIRENLPEYSVLFCFSVLFGIDLFLTFLMSFASHWPISNAKTVLLNLLELYDMQKGDIL
jgi:hypothetical protein